MKEDYEAAIHDKLEKVPKSYTRSGLSINKSI